MNKDIRNWLHRSCICHCHARSSLTPPAKLQAQQAARRPCETAGRLQSFGPAYGGSMRAAEDVRNHELPPLFFPALKLQLPRTASTSNDMMPFSLHGSYKKKGIFSCASNFSVKGHLMCSICWYMSRHQAKKSVWMVGESQKDFLSQGKRISLLY